MYIGANLIVNDQTPSIVDIARRAEDRDVESLFQGEHSHTPVATIYPGSPDGELPEFYKRFPDIFVTLAAAAAVTNRIRLGTGIVLVAEHNPLHLAKAVASLDQPIKWTGGVWCRLRLELVRDGQQRRGVGRPPSGVRREARRAEASMDPGSRRVRWNLRVLRRQLALAQAGAESTSSDPDRGKRQRSVISRPSSTRPTAGTRCTPRTCRPRSSPFESWPLTRVDRPRE